jgi:hypothetical protein
MPRFMHSSHIRRDNFIFGDKKADVDTELLAASTQRLWRLYVGNIKEGTTEEQVCSYCDKAGVHDVKAETLVSKFHRHKANATSMKLEIKYEDKDVVMSANFWPIGVKVRGWRLPRSNYPGRSRKDSWGDECDWGRDPDAISSHG